MQLLAAIREERRPLIVGCIKEVFGQWLGTHEPASREELSSISAQTRAEHDEALSKLLAVLENERELVLRLQQLLRRCYEQDH